MCSEFPELCSVTKPKLGLSLGTKVKILLHHTVVIDSRCVRVELEDINQERLDIDVFLAFFFLLIRPRDLDCTDTSLLSKRRSISRVHTHVKAPSAGCCNSLLLFTFLKGSPWASFRDGLLFEIIFAKSRGGLLFKMNAPNIEMGNYKTICKTTTQIFNLEICLNVKYYSIKTRNSFFTVSNGSSWASSRWTSFRDYFCKVKRGTYFQDWLFLEIKPRD